MTFTNSNRSIVTYTNDKTESGVYTIVVTATAIAFGNITDFSQFTITIQSDYDYCTKNLAWVSGSIPSIPDKTYVAGSNALVVTFTDIQWTPADCISTI